MFTLFRLLEFSFSSIVWGVILSAVCIFLIHLIISGLWNKAEYTPLTFLSGFVLFIALTFNIALIFGGMKVKSLVDDVQASAETVVNTVVKPRGEMIEAGTEEVTKRIGDEYPILAPYLESAKVDASSIEKLPETIANSVRSSINSFILRRVLWSLGFLVVCAIVAVKSVNTAGSTRGYSRHNRASGHRTSGHFSRTGNRRISRRR